jgi:hypothetical protein
MMMSELNGGDARDQIARLEDDIDELAATIESCRKFILAGRVAIAGGGAVIAAMLLGAITFNPSVLALAGAAVLGGIVAAGSNRSTAQQAAQQLSAAEAKRTALIGQIDLRVVGEPNDRN